MSRRRRSVLAKALALTKALAMSLLFAAAPTVLLWRGMLTVAEAPPTSNWTPFDAVLPAAAVFGAVTLLAHVPTAVLGRAHRPLLFVTTLLVVIGLVTQFRVGSPKTPDSPPVSGAIVIERSLWLYFIAVCGCLVAVAIVLRWLRERRLVLALSPAVLLLSFVPFLSPPDPKGGGLYWLQIGPLPQFAPWPFVHLALIIFAASFLARYRGPLTPRPGRGVLGPRAVPYVVLLAFPSIAASVILAVQYDASAAALIFATLVGMTWTATASRAYVLLSAQILVVALGAAVLTQDYFRERTTSWLSPDLFERPDRASVQLAQLLFAIASGLWGAGLGEGQPWVLAEPARDAVIASWAEETGAVGVAVVLGLELLVFLYGMRIAARAPTPFLRLLATGLALTPAIETLIVAGGAARVLPYAAGVTLPFVAASGTSLVSHYVLVGLLTAISAYSEAVRRRPAAATESVAR